MPTGVFWNPTCGHRGFSLYVGAVWPCPTTAGGLPCPVPCPSPPPAALCSRGLGQGRWWWHRPCAEPLAPGLPDASKPGFLRRTLGTRVLLGFGAERTGADAHPLPTRRGEDSRPFSASRQLSTTASHRDTRGLGTRLLGTPSRLPLQRQSPSQPQRPKHLLGGGGVQRKGDPPAGRRETPPKTTAAAFHITWVTARKRRGSGKAVVSDRSERTRHHRQSHPPLPAPNNAKKIK